MDCVSVVVFQQILETLLSTWFIRAILHQERVLFLSTLNSIYEDVFIMELSVPVKKKPFVISFYEFSYFYLITFLTLLFS